MTGVAQVCGIRMVSRFTLCNAAVMAAHATANHLVMVERRNEIGPVSGRYLMTGLT